MTRGKININGSDLFNDLFYFILIK